MSIEDDLRERTRALIRECDFRDVGQFAFRGEQYDRGLAWVHFPEGKGGLGIDRRHQRIVQYELRHADVPYVDTFLNPIGIGMAAPTLLSYADDAAHDRYLRRIFTGEDIWCQMFSEPTHGSDLAGLSCRAVRDGDEWVVNGQKVWTTLAHVARYALLLVRTDPDVPKHKGLSYFVLDMATPGIEVRPLYQITGEAEFNEVFLSDVRVPDANRLGAEGDGWKVAITTLMNERVSIGGMAASRGSGPIRHLVSLWEERRSGFPEAQRAVLRDRVSELWIRAELLRLTNIRARAAAQGGNPGPEGSVGKLVMGELFQHIFETAVDVLGPEGMLHEPGYPMVRVDGVQAAGARAMSYELLRTRANTIEGGTSEILRNVVAERVLGLPGDVSVDKAIPWREVARSGK